MRAAAERQRQVDRAAEVERRKKAALELAQQKARLRREAEEVAMEIERLEKKSHGLKMVRETAEREKLALSSVPELPPTIIVSPPSPIKTTISPPRAYSSSFLSPHQNHSRVQMAKLVRLRPRTHNISAPSSPVPTPPTSFLARCQAWVGSSLNWLKSWFAA